MTNEIEIFFKSRILNKQFTWDEWREFMKSEERKTIVSSDGYEWNISDVCLNPKDIKSKTIRQYWSEWTIKYASFNGKWYFGIDYAFENEGGGFGVWCSDAREYDSEDEVILGAVNHLLSEKRYKGMSEKAREELRLLIRPKPIQLSLF